MEEVDWNARWREGRIGFHQEKVTDSLARYAEEAWGKKRIQRVLVPLCGKSLDMRFLAERAEAVVGVECVRQAIEEFFEEAELSSHFVEGTVPAYTAANYTLFAADFFATTHELIGPLDAVFDRAALVALDASTRTRYAAHIRALLQTGGKVLLVTFDYNQTQMDGPPFAVSRSEVERLFQDGFDVQHLETRDILNQRFRERGLTAMSESAFILTRQ